MPTSWQQVLVIVAALLPGVIFQSLRSFLRGGSPREPSALTQVFSATVATLLFATAYILVSGGSVIELVRPDSLQNHPRTAAIAVTTLVVAVPAIAAAVAHLISCRFDKGSFKKAAQDFFRAGSHATAWDRMASRHFASGYVRITTKDGKVYGGRTGESSYISQTPYPRDLFLHNLWEIDEHGCFIKRVEKDQSNCLGVWVDCANALSVELFEQLPRRAECSEIQEPEKIRKKGMFRWVSAKS